MEVFRVEPGQIEERLQAYFPDAKIGVRDMTGGGDHWQVDITSRKFYGKSLIEQHQMVYKALGAFMKKEIHALALSTSAVEPAEEGH